MSHAKEQTAFSLTDTVVDRGDSRQRPALNSAFTGTTLATSPTFEPEKIPTIDSPTSLATSSTTTPPTKLPDIIPPEHANRTLIVCFDGTGDQFDADNSNIVQLVSLLKKNDRHKQMVYYQAGIGTYTSPKMATPLGTKISKTLDEMFAWNLDAHVMSGYEFLMQNYLEGDKICIFGFSRGAYTARSLAGMLHKVGLLPADNHQQVPFAYKMYTRTDDIGWEQSNAFKLAFSCHVEIDFLGVWDTVDSVGLIPKRLPFTTSNTIVRTFRHAISLDERRAKFKPNLWNRPNDNEQNLGIRTVRIPTPPPMPNGKEKAKNGGTHFHDGEKIRRSESQEDKKLTHNENLYSAKDTAAGKTTNIEEVWFAGCHCDVGGGSVDNKTPNSLARIPLRWMIREIFKANTGMMFHTEALRTIGLDPATLYPHVLPRPPPRLDASQHSFQKAIKPPFWKRITAHQRRKKNAEPMKIVMVNDHSVIDEEMEDLKDAMSPVYDQLLLKRWWWFLEVIPLHLRYQRGNNQWVNQYRPNLANPRFIPKQHSNGVKVHRSVKMRMEARPPPGHNCNYKPKAKFSVEPDWIW